MSDRPDDSPAETTDGTSAADLLEQRETDGIAGIPAMPVFLGLVTGGLLTWTIATNLEYVYVVATENYLGFGRWLIGLALLGAAVGGYAGHRLPERRSSRYLLYPLSFGIVLFVGAGISRALIGGALPFDSRFARGISPTVHAVLVPVTLLMWLAVWEEVYHRWGSSRISSLPRTERTVGQYVGRRTAVTSAGTVVATVVGLRGANAVFGADEGNEIRAPDSLDVDVLGEGKQGDSYSGEEYYVDFLVKNVSSSDRSSVEAEVTFYDEEGATLASSAETIRGLAAGQAETIEVRVSDRPRARYFVVDRIDSFVAEFST